jgi:hypothetical protein
MAFGRDRQLFEHLPLDNRRESKKPKQSVNDKNSDRQQQASVPGGTFEGRKTGKVHNRYSMPLYQTAQLWSG